MNFKEFFKSEQYTWKHKFAFLKIEHQLLGHNTLKGFLHDTDKVFYLYPVALIFGKDKNWIKNKHRLNNRHHVESKYDKSYKDYVEMIIDWECARFTKPDKPLNAFQTMKKFYPDMEPKILPILKKFGLTK